MSNKTETLAHDTSTIFSYEGANITFQNGANVMVNATQMGRSFDKQPAMWLRTSQVKEFLSALQKSKLQKSSLNDSQEVNASGGLTNELYGGLVVTVRGGANPGTWMHQDVALEFARWLSPMFAIWTNDRIKELLTTGVTTVSNDDEMIASAMLILQKRLDAHKQRVQILEGETQMQQAEIKALAPKAQYTDQVLQSTSTFTISQIAHGLHMSGRTLNLKLYALGVQFKQSGQWMLYADYKGKGYTDIRVGTYFNERIGEVETKQSLVWTEKGRAFIHQLNKSGKL